MEISSQKQLREHGQPDFCYLCGEPLANGLPTDRDHCPPKGFFSPADRENYPIILRTHKPCNHLWHGADELVGIVADALHTRRKSFDTSFKKKLDATLVPFGQALAAAVTNLPLAPAAARIVRGMHALLYNDFLPQRTQSKFHIPLPEADPQTGRMVQPLDQTYAFSSTVRRAILTGTADEVRAYNGSFRYACTWDRLDSGTPICLVVFNIYAFHTLAPKVSNFPKCFVGMYIPRQAPVTASWVSPLKVELKRGEVLDPLQRT
ncbi:MAG: hypothetical protein J0H15_04705 [Xanthomonadales bacterium]|nr:hypothetical protein [Xanthomonadales bacterium]